MVCAVLRVYLCLQCIQCNSVVGHAVLVYGTVVVHAVHVMCSVFVVCVCVCAILVVYIALNCGVYCTSGVSVLVACQFCTCEYCTLIWCILMVHMLSWCCICVVNTGGVHSVLVVYTCSILVVYVVLVVHTCMCLWCMLSWWCICVTCTYGVCCPGGVYM